MDRSCVIEESEEIELNSIEEELVDEDTLEEEVNDDNDMKEELAGDSKFFWPCAPDGYVPNSIVRDLIKPVKPPDYSALIRELEANQANERFLKGMSLFILFHRERSISPGGLLNFGRSRGGFKDRELIRKGGMLTKSTARKQGLIL